MLLNNGKIQLLKLTLREPKYSENCVMNSVPICPSIQCKLLAVTIDTEVSLADYIDDIVHRTNFKFYTVRLKKLRVTEKCLMTFFVSHRLSIIT